MAQTRKSREPHPFANAWQCEKWEPDRPCLCPAWQDYEPPIAMGPGPFPRRWTGCYFQLARQMNEVGIAGLLQAMSDAGAIRRDVQDGQEAIRQQTAAGFRSVAEVFAQGFGQVAASLPPGSPVKRIEP